MTQKERAVIEAATEFLDRMARDGAHHDDTLAARNRLFLRVSELEGERASTYWREVGA